MTIAFFAVSGLDVMDALSEIDNTNVSKEQICDWVYRLQILPSMGEIMYSLLLIEIRVLLKREK